MRVTYRMDREIESLRKRLEFLEQQKLKEEEKERKKETIEYNLKIIQDAATKMKEESQRHLNKYSAYHHMCKDYSEAFEAIHNSLRLINQQLNTTVTKQ